MGRGEADKQSHEAFYWQLRDPASALLPDNDEGERYLFLQSLLLDKRDRLTTEGLFTILLSWQMRLGDPLTASNRASALEKLLEEDDECKGAASCADHASCIIYACALISHADGWWAARKAGDEMTERIRKKWRSGRGVSLHKPQPLAPSTK
jgi:hypothetical protein